jgi:hypothetical protein
MYFAGFPHNVKRPGNTEAFRVACAVLFPPFRATVNVAYHFAVLVSAQSAVNVIAIQFCSAKRAIHGQSSSS